MRSTDVALAVACAAVLWWHARLPTLSDDESPTGGHVQRGYEAVQEAFRYSFERFFRFLSLAQGLGNSVREETQEHLSFAKKDQETMLRNTMLCQC